MSQTPGAMTVLASITMPAFSDDDLATLRRVEAVLARHPYMRADLGARGAISRELEAVLSTRLALLHTLGAPDACTEVTSLHDKLRTWEWSLRKPRPKKMTRNGSGSATRRRSSSTPRPRFREEPQSTTATIATVTRAWERLRETQSLRSVVAR